VVDTAIIDQLRKAADALNNGDPGPLASMFADDAEWRGVSSVPPVVETDSVITRPRRGP